MKSLDPRINRLGITENTTEPLELAELEQWQTYEVFHQKNPQELHYHVGAVHACNTEMAFLFAKEQYARRLQCHNIWVVKTAMIYAYNVEDNTCENFNLEQTQVVNEPQIFDIFIQPKRGNHPVYLNSQEAKNVWEAIQATTQVQKECFMIWAVAQKEVYRQPEEEADMYFFVPKKSYRDATGYKVMAKLNKIRKVRKENEQKS